MNTDKGVSHYAKLFAAGSLPLARCAMFGTDSRARSSSQAGLAPRSLTPPLYLSMSSKRRCKVASG
eukprot:216840-Rhodomonas_salina.2